MKSLPVLLSLIVIGGALLGALLVHSEHRHRRAAAELATTQTQVSGLNVQLTNAAEQNRALEQRASTLEASLAQTKAELTAAIDRQNQLTRELSQAAAELSVREETQHAMARQITGLERELAAARSAIVPPETLASYRTTIADLERQLASARNGAITLEPAHAQPAVSARILSIGPSNSFVVLDYGGDRGAAVGQRLHIKRGTETLAHVLISDVRGLLSIAHVQPDSLRGVLHKGDSAVLTN